MGYRILERGPSDIFRNELRNILQTACSQGLLDKKEMDFLLPTTYQIPTFYGLPKIHKGVHPLKCRPIVSGINSLSQNVGIYLDEILKPFVLSLPSYLRDTTDLLGKLEGVSFGDHFWLCSIDVEALYSSIPHNCGLRAVKDFLGTRSLFLEAHNRFVLELMEYVLTRNYFLFNGKFFHQLRGTAMGSPCAPTYANLLLGWWENNIVFSDEFGEFH